MKKTILDKKFSYKQLKNYLVIFTYFFVFIYFLSLTNSAIQTQFNDTTTSKNFSGDRTWSNLTYIKLPKSSIVTNANLNLTGYHNNVFCYQETANISTACGGLNIGSYYISIQENPEYVIDGNWSSFGRKPLTGFASVYINYSIPNNTVDVLFQNKFDNFFDLLFDPPGTYQSKLFCHNGTDWMEIYDYTSPGSLVSGDLNITIKSDCFINNLLQLHWRGYSSGSGNPLKMYEEAIWWNFGSFPYNVTIYIGNNITPIFNHTGIFNSTNITSNFSDKINDFINTCSPDVNDYCYVPINITATNGTINLYNLNILFTENNSPSYFNFVHNASTVTKINGVVNWSVTLSDNIGLSSYIFAHNQSGSLTNSTPNVAVSGASTFVNETLTINLSKGNYICGQYWFNDTSNNINQTNLSCFTVANSIPSTPTVYYPVNNNNYSTIAYINYSSSDADSDTITYKIYINNTLNISTTVNLTLWNASDGYYAMNVSATDGTGSSANASAVYFTLDSTAPTVNIIYPTNGLNISSNSIYLNASATDNRVTSLTYYWLINGTMNTTTINSNTTFNASDGYYNLTLKVSDGIQNGSSTIYFTLDSTAPTVNIIYPTNGLNISSNSIYLNASATDNRVTSLTYYWLINGTMNTTTINSNSTFNASDGYYNLTLKVSDGLQNGSATIYFTLDTIPPSFSNNQDNSTSITPKYNDVVQLNLTITDNLIGLHSYILAHNDTGSFVNTTVRYVSGATHKAIENITIANLKRGGVLGWKVQANDSLNNIAISSIYTLTIKNTNITLKTDLSFINWSSGHKFNATTTFTDLDGIADITYSNISFTSGDCDYHSNSTSGSDITIKYNCSGTALTSTTIQLNATDFGGVIANSSFKTNIFPNNIPTMSSVELNKTSGVINTDDLNCSAVGASDIDPEDIPTYHYEWYNNSVAKGIDDVRLLSTNLTGLGTWYCEAWVTDSYQNSPKYTSSSVPVNSSEVSPSIITFNATTAQTGINSTSSNPSNNNSWINFSIFFSDVNNNLWTAYICTTPNSNCTLNISSEILCKSENNLTDKTLTCAYNLSGYTGTNPLTVYGFILDNTSLPSSAKSTTFEVNYPQSIPLLVYPPSNTYININYTLINWSATDSDGDAINYSLYINSSSGFELIYNGTNTFFNYSGFIEYTTYWLRIYSKDEHNYGVHNITLGNFTADFTNPNLTVSSPTATTYNAETVSLTINATDFRINICNYTLYYKDTDILKKSNNSINCTGTISLSTPYYSRGYKLDVFAYDKAGNINSTQINFTTQEATTSPSSSTGGKPEEEGLEKCLNTTWSITSLGNKDRIDLLLKIGSITPKSSSFKLSNTGFQDVSLKLNCNDVNGTLCKSLNFSQNTITLAPSQFEAKELQMLIKHPDEVNYGEKFIYNIIADDNKCYQLLNVYAETPSRYSPTGRTITIGKLELPIFPIALISSIIAFITLFGIFSLFNKPYLAWWFGFLGSSLSFSALFFLL